MLPVVRIHHDLFSFVICVKPIVLFFVFFFLIHNTAQYCWLSDYALCLTGCYLDVSHRLRSCKLSTATHLPYLCSLTSFPFLSFLAKYKLLSLPPPAPLHGSVLFWSHSCANVGTNLCQFILQAEELSVSQVPWACPAGSLGCFLSLSRVYFWCSLSRQGIR